MAIKCLYCGNMCSHNDIYCPKCGQKIFIDESLRAPITSKKQNEASEKISENLELSSDELKFLEEKLEKASDVGSTDDIKVKSQNGLEDIEKKFLYTFEPKSKSKVSGFMFNFLFYFLIACCFALTTTFIVLSKQATQKTYLEYKNMIHNPQLIPELKEPTDISELISNLSEVERFLYMYLRFSADSTEIKNATFASFLREMDKFPHITNEILIQDKNDECASISTSTKAQKCASRITKSLNAVGIKAYPVYNTVYLYPDSKFIKDRYSRFLNDEFKQYLNLSARYNKPSGIGLELYMRPKTLVNKITDFENLYNKTTDPTIKDWLENTIYNDFRKLIFTPSIYDTTTQEMTNDFRSAYRYFIQNKKNSALRPVIMSYMDKQRSYDETNFKNDYPFKIYENSFADNVQSSTFSDVFSQLRNTILSEGGPKDYAFVYNFFNASWSNFTSQEEIKPSNFILSQIDSNNTIAVYNNSLTEVQQLTVPASSELFLANNNLLIYNASKLALSKIIFNGKNFLIQELSSFEITSVFPGVEVLVLDSYQNRNITLEKDNRKTTYMLLSRHRSGFENYQLGGDSNSISLSGLPNMFTVDTLNDTLVVFAKTDSEGNVDGDNFYSFKIHTRGQAQTPSEPEYAQYDNKTAEEESSNPDRFEANIKPKIENRELQQDSALVLPPEQRIEPPKDDVE